MIGRVALGTAGPRDLVSLRLSLEAVPRIKLLLDHCQAPLMRSLLAELDELADVRALIERTLLDEPPAIVREGGFTEMVSIRARRAQAISRSGRQVIAEMEDRERTRTGISSLKVRFNRVFGGIASRSRRPNLHLVPADYLRKQTIAGGERFTTQPLKEHEEKVLGADERILARELEIFEALRSSVATEASRVQDTARALATLDVLAGLAETAAIANYTKPHLHEGDEFVVADGRHPVVEWFADAFVPNDIDLNGTSRQLVVLTGPNMGGKSTYLRQTALIPLMAQIGSFVPRHAKLPVVDRIFARVGASDNIARGQSTFMVEMQETANILHTATSRSLVVLDEIGRGKSTLMA